MKNCPRLILAALGLCLASLPCFAQTIDVSEATLNVVVENGSRINRVNLVILGDGYTAAELHRFPDDAQAVIDFLFSEEPFITYEPYFNVYTISVPSLESGADHIGEGIFRNTAFDATFGFLGIERLMVLSGTGSMNVDKVLEAVLPEADMVLVLVNDPTYGGGGGRYAVASVNALSKEVGVHELGHTFGYLADEYDAAYETYTPIESPNATALSNREAVRWRSWIDPVIPVPTPASPPYSSTPTGIVGLYEGAQYQPAGWFRPHFNSRMRDSSQPWGTVNREQLTLRILEVGPNDLDAYWPTTRNLTAQGVQPLQFSITPKQPNGHDLFLYWSVNGSLIPEFNGSTTMTVSSNQLGNGRHEITGWTYDPTTFVRNDSNYARYGSRSWFVDVSGVVSPAISSFQPVSGRWGSIVEIQGTELSGITGVSFNGQPATFNIVSGNRITATVPVGATTGPVTVTSDGFPFASASEFEVQSGVIVWGSTSSAAFDVPIGLQGASKLAVGASHVAALLPDGTVRAWGSYGEGVPGGAAAAVPPGLPNVLQIASGEDHTIALLNNGTVVGWGDNSFGQANPPPGLSGVVMIAAGDYHSLALTINGTVVAWGFNYGGQTNVPPGLTNVVGLTGGLWHSCALRADGTVVAWGQRSQDESTAVPHTVPFGLTGVRKIVSGSQHTLALKEDGTVVSFGYNQWGQILTPPGLSGVTDIAAGYAHSVALKNDGSIVAWGLSSAVQIPPFLQRARMIDAGSFTAAYRDESGAGFSLPAIRVPVITGVGIVGGKVGQPIQYSVNATGNAFFYQTLGLPPGLSLNSSTGQVTGAPSEAGTFTTYFRAVNPAGAGEKIVQFRIDPAPPAIMTLDPDVVAEHRPPGSEVGQFFTDDITFQTTYTLVSGEGDDDNGSFTIVEQQIGNQRRFRLRTTAAFDYEAKNRYRIRVRANGPGGSITETFTILVLNRTDDDDDGDGLTEFAEAQLGTDPFNPDTDGDGVPDGAESETALDATDHPPQVIAWGAGTTNTGIPNAGQSIVPSNLWNAVRVAAGQWHSYAIRSNGTLTSWGDNSQGQRTTPALANPVDVTAGQYYTLALQANGVPKIWGWNLISVVNQIPPGLADCVAIGGSLHHALAVTKSGTVVAWGNNSDGQTTIPANLERVLKVDGGSAFSVALDASGTVHAWGNNDYGQTDVPHFPRRAVDVAAGHYHVVVLLDDGTVRAFGAGAFRPEGQGAFPHAAQSLVPDILMNPETANVMSVSAGSRHSTALRADGTVLSWGANDRLQVDTPQTVSGAVQISSGAEHNLVLRVQPAAPRLNLARSIYAKPGVEFQFDIPATGTDLAFEAFGLPAGLSLDPESGAIAGVPSTPGDYLARIRVENSRGQDQAVVYVGVVETAYEFWRRTQFPSTLLGDVGRESDLWGFSADPDADRHPNVLEFLFGGDALVPDGESGPWVEYDGDQNTLSLLYPKRRDTSGILSQVRWSRELVEWFGSGEGPSPRMIAETVEETGATEDVIRATISLEPEDTALFLNIEVLEP